MVIIVGGGGRSGRLRPSRSLHGGGAAWLVSGAVLRHIAAEVSGRAPAAAAEVARRPWSRELQISGRPYGYAAPGVDVDADPGRRRSSRSTAGSPTVPRWRCIARSTISSSRGHPGLRRSASVPAPRRTSRSCAAWSASTSTADWAETLQGHVEDGGDTRSGSCWPAAQRTSCSDSPAGESSVAIPHVSGPSAWPPRPVAGEPAGRCWTPPCSAWPGRASGTPGSSGPGPALPAHRLYTSRGFTPLRTFTPYTVPTDHGDVIRPQEGTTR